MRYYCFSPCDLQCGFYLSNKIPINPGVASPDPRVIPLSGSACTSLSDIDTNQKATTERALCGGYNLMRMQPEKRRTGSHEP